MGIERIFSAPYHPQSNGKLETFHKFLKPTLKKMCADDQDNWDDYVKQVLGTYRGVPNLTTGESPFFRFMEETEANQSTNYFNHSPDS